MDRSPNPQWIRGVLTGVTWSKYNLPYKTTAHHRQLHCLETSPTHQLRVGKPEVPIINCRQVLSDTVLTSTPTSSAFILLNDPVLLVHSLVIVPFHRHRFAAPHCTGSKLSPPLDEATNRRGTQ
jgi:hypothetical protein